MAKYSIVCTGFEPIEVIIPDSKIDQEEELIKEFAEEHFNGQTYEVINLKTVEFRVL